MTDEDPRPTVREALRSLANGDSLSDADFDAAAASRPAREHFRTGLEIRDEDDDEIAWPVITTEQVVSP